jgi:hypothetical protein
MAEFREVVRTAHLNGPRRNFPGTNDPRSSSGLLFPSYRPKFPIQFDGITIFTLGSCFARNIEEVLAACNVSLPTLAFSAPKSEWPARANGLLNEFNPGTMRQRVLFALQAKDYPVETIVPMGDSYIDLLLPTGGAPVTFERAVARRNEIASVYASLSSSNLVIITLGLIEAWFDNLTNLYLNRMPPQAFADRHRGRFELRSLDVSDSVSMLREALEALTNTGPRILLTVSPVPLKTTLTADDCIVANEFSKSVLRVTAQLLASHPMIDYFPSYEIVRSGGTASYDEDGVHVKTRVVERVTSFMLAAFANSGKSST